jgi:hypothetical protein
LAETVAVLSASYVACDGLTLEDLVWRTVDGGSMAAADMVRHCDFLLMASVDSLDARGISCMAVGGLLHRIPEHTRVDNGAFALLLAHAMVTAKDRSVCVLAWEKPTDTSLESLVAMAGDPHYERPLHWTAGIEEALSDSRRKRLSVIAEDGRPLPHDRAACIVVGRDASAATTLSARRLRTVSDTAIAMSPVQYPSPSPVDPLQRVAERTSGEASYALGASDQIVLSVTSALENGLVSNA